MEKNTTIRVRKAKLSDWLQRPFHCMLCTTWLICGKSLREFFLRVQGRGNDCEFFSPGDHQLLKHTSSLNRCHCNAGLSYAISVTFLHLARRNTLGCFLASFSCGDWRKWEGWAWKQSTAAARREGRVQKERSHQTTALHLCDDGSSRFNCCYYMYRKVMPVFTAGFTLCAKLHKHRKIEQKMKRIKS